MTPQRKKTAFRLKVIEFKNPSGTEATVEAFGICRATNEREWEGLLE
ncbi:MAG: hypothetical protein RMI93_04905 [Caldimicrobium sp.]|nr:hypothetical protein [Caldimicrobium sp.]MDW8182924.1 hypothetical protein [Caldimicrobium sp.]